MNKRALRPLMAVALWMTVTVWGCGEEKTQKKIVEQDDISKLAALPTEVPFPADNAPSDEKVALGRLLFFDPILSGHRDVACATCHHPEFGFAESLELSIGANGRGMGSKRTFNVPNDIPFVKRNSQTILNAAFNGITLATATTPSNAPMFWDVRAKSLENQALEPIKALEEMRGHQYASEAALDSVVNRLRKNKEYQSLFRAAFPMESPITVENMAKAIAAYERTLVGGNSRFDQYLRGDKNALSINEVDGMQAFLKSGCAKCHNGPMLSDYQLHALGVADNEKLAQSDAGVDNQYKFRTPSLRNLRYTAPYMHSGTLKTLEHVLEFYEDLAGDKIRNPKVKKEQLDPIVENLKVDFKDISLIVEFLNTLNDDQFDRSVPQRVPSGLKPGGNLN
ncbi:cytochrome-c peroxidase [Runella sp. CRIBMP]|uniref:cytochrome-c peroxidase n=1 Tax=Runella sp. CRIBMP TaxID=2683261 RepID=UPI001411C1D4|nr:cytochrome-c peroxidase [Runella sp. CRIBMP]NBB17978.1 cytochrome-c peroxidase [Runella sp. CRIBMP]